MGDTPSPSATSSAEAPPLPPSAPPPPRRHEDGPRGEAELEDEEGDERAPLEVAHQEPHREPAAQKRGGERREERPRIVRRDPGLQELQELQPARARRDRDAEG